MRQWVVLVTHMLQYSQGMNCTTDHCHSEVVARASGNSTGPDTEELFMMSDEASPMRRRTGSEGSFEFVPTAGTVGRAAGTASAAGTADVAGTTSAETLSTAGTVRSAGTDVRLGVAAGTVGTPSTDKLPEPCCGDRESFPDWVFLARAYFVSQGLASPAELRAVESWSTPIRPGSLSQDELHRSQMLYYRLIQMVRGHCLRILKPVEAGNGFEAWRILVQDMTCLEEGQSIGLMQQMMDFTFDRDQDYEQQLAQLDLLVEMYRRQHGETSVPDDMLKAVVIRGAPPMLRSHLQLLRVPTYRDLKKTLVQYLQASRMWPGSLAVGQETETVQAISKGRGKSREKNKMVETEIQCFNCRGYGHSASQCPSPRKDRSQWPAASSTSSAPPSTSTTGTVCYRCGKKGHIAMNCQETLGLLTENEIDRLPDIPRVVGNMSQEEYESWVEHHEQRLEGLAAAAQEGLDIEEGHEDFY
eukprot:TRINITY_DN64355_c0_g1_i1.p1 TRINITY_DN64355_c0_g1~~TRINITY_DN64355_c0_g1_i1.p1  ORF type:complete len:472 (-),score=48.75 TRINITY_DN64355_c0_g1_i1:1695-3110(-)